MRELPNFEFGKRFIRACRDAGLPDTQNELGKALGVSGPMAHNYKKGIKLPSMATALRIAQKTGVCVEWLLTGRGPVHPGAADMLDLGKLPPKEKRAVKSLYSALLGHSDESAE